MGCNPTLMLLAAAPAKASGCKMEMECRVFSLEPGRISVSIKVVDSAICGVRSPWVVYPIYESTPAADDLEESGIPT